MWFQLWFPTNSEGFPLVKHEMEMHHIANLPFKSRQQKTHSAFSLNSVNCIHTHSTAIEAFSALTILVYLFFPLISVFQHNCILQSIALVVTEKSLKLFKALQAKKPAVCF